MNALSGTWHEKINQDEKWSPPPTLPIKHSNLEKNKELNRLKGTDVWFTVCVSHDSVLLDTINVTLLDFLVRLLKCFQRSATTLWLPGTRSISNRIKNVRLRHLAKEQAYLKDKSLGTSWCPQNFISIRGHFKCS